MHRKVLGSVMRKWILELLWRYRVAADGFLVRKAIDH